MCFSSVQQLFSSGGETKKKKSGCASGERRDRFLSFPRKKTETGMKIEDCCLYVLKLQQDKFYVGRVNDEKGLGARFEQHVSGKGEGSSWTTMYEPVEILQTIPRTDSFAEDALTLRLMHQYGIDNVRGGCYSAPVLSLLQQSEIERKIRAATDACLKCGEYGHFIRDCPQQPKSRKRKATKKRKGFLPRKKPTAVPKKTKKIRTRTKKVKAPTRRSTRRAATRSRK